MPLYSNTLWVMYRVPSALEPRPIPDLGAIQHKPFEAADLDRFFHGDPIRKASYRSFLAKGFKGVLLHEGETWVGYSWMAPPFTGVPPHLPQHLARTGHPFFLHAHVREGYRSRGLNAVMQSLKIHMAPTDAEGRRMDIYTDVRVDNGPARRSQLRAGFAPAGTLRVRILSFGPLGRFVWGRWHRDRPHPPLPEKD